MNPANDTQPLLAYALAELSAEEQALVQQAMDNAMTAGRKGHLGPVSALELIWALGRWINTHPGVKLPAGKETDG